MFILLVQDHEEFIILLCLDLCYLLSQGQVLLLVMVEHLSETVNVL